MHKERSLELAKFALSFLGEEKAPYFSVETGGEMAEVVKEALEYWIWRKTRCGFTEEYQRSVDACFVEELANPAPCLDKITSSEQIPCNCGNPQPHVPNGCACWKGI
jgi:hypothetical protein